MGPIKNNTWPLSPVAAYVTQPCWLCTMEKRLSIAIPHDLYVLKVIISNNSHKISITCCGLRYTDVRDCAILGCRIWRHSEGMFHVLLVHPGWSIMGWKLRFHLQVSILQLHQHLFWLLTSWKEMKVKLATEDGEEDFPDFFSVSAVVFRRNMSVSLLSSLSQLFL